MKGQNQKERQSIDFPKFSVTSLEQERAGTCKTEQTEPNKRNKLKVPTFIGRRILLQIKLRNEISSDCSQNALKVTLTRRNALSAEPKR